MRPDVGVLLFSTSPHEADTCLDVGMTQENSGSLTGLTGAPEATVNTEVTQETPQAEETQAAPVTTEDEKDTEESTLDYKALLEQSTKDKDKLATDLKREQGRTKARDQMPAWAEALRQDNQGTKGILNLLADVVLQGDEADRPAARTKLSEMAAREQTSAAEQPYMGLSQDWATEAQDKAGDLGINLGSDVRTREIARLWDATAKKGDIQALWGIRREMIAALDEISAEKQTKERTQQEREQVDVRRRSGELKTDAGKTGGGGGAGKEEIRKQYAAGDIPWSDAVRDALAEMGDP